MVRGDRETRYCTCFGICMIGKCPRYLEVGIVLLLVAGTQLVERGSHRRFQCRSANAVPVSGFNSMNE